jgi:hypothetical protein
MILNKLFRRLPQFNLGYVVGEILLIFIGITLSFSFDEWRTNRQKRVKEIEILNQIAVAVRYDTSRLGVLAILNDYASNKMRYLLDSTRLEKSPSPKTLKCLAYLNYYYEFTPDFTAYDNLKNEGLNLVSNSALRLKMMSYYDQMEEQKQWTQNISDEHFGKEVGPYIIDEFSDYLREEKAIPENFDSLNANKRFWKIVKRTKMFYDVTSLQLKSRKKLATEFLHETEAEIDSVL